MIDEQMSVTITEQSRYFIGSVGCRIYHQTWEEGVGLIEECIMSSHSKNSPHESTDFHVERRVSNPSIDPYQDIAG